MDINGKLVRRVDQLIEWYGDGEDGSSPTRQQWRHVVSRREDKPVTFINFFKIRDSSCYPRHSLLEQMPVTGEEAFDLYAKVSIPAVGKVGGKFLLLAPFEATFIGKDEDWSVVAVGEYPNTIAALELYEDSAYRSVFIHRSAACERQKVLICTPQ